ncbi:hypothetical protein ACFL1H_06685 [Nanoarchaeota archaeon]
MARMKSAADIAMEKKNLGILMHDPRDEEYKISDNSEFYKYRDLETREEYRVKIATNVGHTKILYEASDNIYIDYNNEIKGLLGGFYSKGRPGKIHDIFEWNNKGERILLDCGSYGIYDTKKNKPFVDLDLKEEEYYCKLTSDVDKRLMGVLVERYKANTKNKIFKHKIGSEPVKIDDSDVHNPVMEMAYFEGYTQHSFIHNLNGRLYYGDQKLNLAVNDDYNTNLRFKLLKQEGKIVDIAYWMHKNKVIDIVKYNLRTHEQISIDQIFCPRDPKDFAIIRNYEFHNKFVKEGRPWQR